jgi:hypothetical protein
MTAVMNSGFDQLPVDERYPLPPRQITSRIGRELHVWHRLSEQEKRAVTLTAHFWYGAAAGALYGACVAPRFRNCSTGVAYGMMVWTGSYLGVLPALGILPAATKHPPARNTLMIAAHVVWGAALGGMLRRNAAHGVSGSQTNNSAD